MPELPSIDEHAVVVRAPAGRAWAAVIHVVGVRLSARTSRVLATALACADRTSIGDPEAVGATLPGFRVARSELPRTWALEGEHHFARYALSFYVDQVDDTRSRVRAESRAVFPDRQAAVYRALVIGSLGHVIAVRSLLRGIKRHAESDAAPFQREEPSTHRQTSDKRS